MEKLYSGNKGLVTVTFYPKTWSVFMVHDCLPFGRSGLTIKGNYYETFSFSVFKKLLSRI